MAVLKAVKKTSIKSSLERLSKQGAVGDSTFISFRDADYNTVLKARQVYQDKNPMYRFSVTKDSKNEQTEISRLE